MLPLNRIPTHPGVILDEHFLEPLGLTQVALAKHLGIPVQRVNEIVRGKRGISPQTAWLLAHALETNLTLPVPVFIGKSPDRPSSKCFRALV